MINTVSHGAKISGAKGSEESKKQHQRLMELRFAASEFEEEQEMRDLCVVAKTTQTGIISAQ
jgi:hypothetical protein